MELGLDLGEDVLDRVKVGLYGGRNCWPAPDDEPLSERQIGLTDPDNGSEEIQLSFSSLDLGNIDMKESDRIALEALSFRFVSLDVRQT